MQSRSLQKKSISCKSQPCITTQIFCQKMDEDNCRNLTNPHIRACKQMRQQFKKQVIIQEEDYNKLMTAYQRIDQITRCFQQITKDVSDQLTEFLANQLLFPSKAPLWSAKRPTNTLELYCLTALLMDENFDQFFLIEGPFGKYLAIRKNKSSLDFHILQTDSFILNLIRHRKKFLSQFNEKYGKNNKINRISQISLQIIFLYSEYKKKKEQIMEKIRQKQVFYGQKQNQFDAQLQIKSLLKQLKANKIDSKSQKRF